MMALSHWITILITILSSPVRFIQIPQNKPKWVSVEYNQSQDKLTFTFTQTALDFNMTTSYKFISDPIAVERTVLTKDTSSTVAYDSSGNPIYRIVASIIGIPDNTYTFIVYGANVANNEQNLEISASSPSIVDSEIVSNR